MSQIVKLRRSSTGGNRPTNSQLQLGELAINTTDGKLYFAKSGSLDASIEEVLTTNTQNTGSLNLSGSFNLIGTENITGSLNVTGSLRVLGNTSLTSLMVSGSDPVANVQAFVPSSSVYNPASFNTPDRVAAGIRFNWSNENWTIGAARGATTDVDGLIFSRNGVRQMLLDESNNLVLSGSINLTGSFNINGTEYTAATSGTSGSNGTNGSSGSSGSNGTNGSSGSSGSNGTNGSSGSSGSNGTNGSSGSSGTSGSNGTNGSSGSSGSNGTNGSSGSSGLTGANGTSGTSGSNGTNGSSGSSGSNGTNGSSGSNGTNGSSGSSGSNGTNGSSGTSGSNGSSGTSGSNGTNGSSGTSGDSLFALTGSVWETTNNAKVNGDLTITGTLTAKEIHTALVTSSVMYESGSTKFGDTLDDNHNFTGSVKITGSLYVNGAVVGTGKLDETAFNAYTSSNTSTFAGTSSYALTASYVANPIIVSGSTKKTTVTSAATTWSLNHGMNERYPSITVFDSDGYVVIPTSVRAVDTNNIEVHFSSAQTGTVIATLGGAGATGASGIGGYTQTYTSATTWSVAHNLDLDYPGITVWDSNRKVIIPGEITSIDSNNLQITFPSAQAGEVHIVRGGHQVNGAQDLSAVGTITPSADGLYNLGSTSKQFNNVYISGSLLVNGVPYSGGSGTSGSSGTSGINGTSGSNGTSGTNGTSGSNGTNGSSGTSGSNGTNGSSGSNGTSGTNGTSGSNGTNGTSGTSPIVDLGSLATTGSNTFIGTQTLSGSIIPSVNLAYDLGDPTHWWKDIYVGTGSIYVGGVKAISANVDGTLQIGSQTVQTAASIAAITATGGTANSVFKGNQTISGSLIPVGSGSFDLGSATNPFRHLYLSSASLYIDGQKVLGSTNQELQITTDAGQSIKILETGTDTITLQSVDGDIQLKSSGGGNVLLDPTTGVIDLRGTVQVQDGNKITSSGGNSVVFGNNVVVTGSLTTTGNITANSASFNYLYTIYETSSVVYSQGSNQFGDELSDVQTLSGSVKVQGNLYINGTSYTAATSGTSGSNGTNGSSGISGSSGTSGSNGTNGSSGSSGLTGANGTSGTSGSNGTNGSSGSSGSNGTNGSSGSSGSNGSSGTSGSNGSSGTSGSNGTNGSSGTSITTSGTNNKIVKFTSTSTVGDSQITDDGTTVTIPGSLVVQGNLTAQQYIVSSSVLYVTESYASGSNNFGNTFDDFHNVTGSLNITGSLSINGTSYTAATSGTSGSNGTNGSSGSSGSNGSSGTSGSNGTNGSSGSSGSNGSSGTSGSNGTNGSSGSSGSNGSSGTSGSNGTNGSSGSSGSNGSSGTSGSNGTNGSSGSSGSNGSSGTSGSNGTNGSSGSSGSNGTNGSSGTSITTSGTTNNLTKFTSSTTVGNSSITDSGTVVSLTTGMNITGSILPGGATGTYDLGSSTARWGTVYTSDLSLNNGIGNWTIVEGEDDLFLYNNKKGKVYKFALIEVDPSVATPKKS